MISQGRRGFLTRLLAVAVAPVSLPVVAAVPKLSSARAGSIFMSEMGTFVFEPGIRQGRYGDYPDEWVNWEEAQIWPPQIFPPSPHL